MGRALGFYGPTQAAGFLDGPNLVRARYLAGDVDGALRSWSRAATTMRQELGVDPSAELRALQHAMLHRDQESVRRPTQLAHPHPTSKAR